MTLLPLLFLVAVIAFTLVRMTPGDPAAVAAGSDATPAQVAQMRHSMGLDRPLPVQFLDWMKRVFLHADLGKSLTMNAPVLKVISQRAQPTLLLAVLGAFFALLFGIPIGIFAAVNHNSWIDRVLMSGAIIGLSIPNFWLGLLLVLTFSIHWSILPPSGFQNVQDAGLSTLKYLVLPAFAIGVAQAAFLARMVRSSMLDVLRQDYVRTASAKGLRGRTVLFRHALKNAMIPPLTVIGMLVANLASGTVIIEIVFNIPGAGRLLIDSISRRDYPIMQGVIIITAFIYILANLTVDILYGVIDPRVRYE